MGHEAHKRHAPARIRCWVITVSDTRTEASDASGRLMRDLLEGHGHTVSRYRLVRDEPREITALLQAGGEDPQVDALLLNGGTGISRRDRTYEAVVALLEKRLDGFGELFRYLSYQEIGPAAILSRAVAGVYRGKVIVSLPGSEDAVRLGMEKLVLPELGHMVAMARS